VAKLKVPKGMVRTKFGTIKQLEYFWEEHFTIMKQDLEDHSSPYILICNRTGAHLAHADSPDGLNVSALKELDNIFENNVLLSE
jgi:hypothetical protein